MAPEITVVAAVIRQKGKLLLTTRPLDKPPFGLEFPGGKVDKGETLAQALKRELQEELAVDALILDPIYMTSNGRIKLWFIRAIIPEDAEIKCCENQEYFWVDPGDPQALQDLWKRYPLLPNDYDFWHFLFG